MVVTHLLQSSTDRGRSNKRAGKKLRRGGPFFCCSIRLAGCCLCNPDTTAPTANLHWVIPGQLSHSAVENCLCKKLTETWWGYCQLKTACARSWQRPGGVTVSWKLPVQEADRDPVGLLSVASLGLNDDTTQALISSPESLLAVNWFSGGLSFKTILTESAKEYWWEAGSPEAVLGWDFMAIVVQLASLPLKNAAKWLNRFMNKDIAESRLKGSKMTFHLIHTSWFSVVSLAEERDRNSLYWFGRLSSPAVVNPCGRWWVACSGEHMLSTFVTWSSIMVNVPATC